MDIDIFIGQRCLQEIVSMTNQLYFVHALNRMSHKPFRHCAFTGINGRLKERFDNKLNGEYVKFSRMEWRGEDVQEMRQAPARTENEWKEFRDGKRKTQNAPTISAVDLSSSPLRNPFEGQEYVYLSADAEEELDTLKENETYIIGGIVDRNRYKVSPALDK
jgi:tRNA (guanine9-N1)-methyltransferase